jgi:hypothetical protein
VPLHAHAVRRAARVRSSIALVLNITIWNLISFFILERARSVLVQLLISHTFYCILLESLIALFTRVSADYAYMYIQDFFEDLM